MNIVHQQFNIIENINYFVTKICVAIQNPKPFEIDFQILISFTYRYYRHTNYIYIYILPLIPYRISVSYIVIEPEKR